MNYIRLTEDQAPVIRARLLSVLFTLVTKSRPLHFVRDLSKSQTIYRTKSRKIPNDISYEISQNTKRYLVRNLARSQTIFRAGEGKQLDAFILDFSKAFDWVPHGRLLYKLNHYGINGNLLAWVEDFLTERTQSVALEGVSSMPCRVTSGVLQGTGPLLFLLYVNDLSLCISSSIRLFADGCLLYRTIDDSNDSLNLHNDLNALNKW